MTQTIPKLYLIKSKGLSPSDILFKLVYDKVTVPCPVTLTVTGLHLHDLDLEL